jgi:hypothetical protein
MFYKLQSSGQAVNFRLKNRSRKGRKKLIEKVIGKEDTGRE